jgi:hypothetical protein
MSQIAVYTQTSGPGSGTVTSVSGGTGITITGNPAINPTVNLTVPVVIANGGTNATSFSTTDGVVYYNGTRLVTTSAGLAGQILTSQGPGMPPIYATNAGGTITLNADSGSATGDPITIAGGHDINTSASGTTLTVALNNAITLGDLAPITGSSALTLTTGDMRVLSGNINLTPTNTAGTSGVINVLGQRWISNYSSDNIFIGYLSGNFTGSGTGLIGIGQSVFDDVTTASNSVAVGTGNFDHLTTGTQNTGLGYESFNEITASTQNTGVGYQTGFSHTSGDGNSYFGAFAGTNCLTGANNIAVGFGAGDLWAGAESNNLCIGNTGVLSESNTIHIGTQGSSTGQQNACFIAGITGVTTSNSNMVTINTSTGQLGAAAVPVSATTWSVITADQNAAVNNGYICNKGSVLTLTLPTTSAVGSIIEVTGMNTALGWKIAQNANQLIHFGTSTTTTGVTGSLASTNIYDAIRIVCNIANLSWIVLSAQGNITVV